MAPKKQSAKSQKGQEKAKTAAKQKVAEDKTFGLKNKNKSQKVQKFVQQVQSSAAANENKQKQARIAAQQGQQTKDAKSAAKAKQEELNKLFAANIQQPKVPVGVDPKSILCEFYKHGLCTKGTRCKFSHDKDISRKAVKIDVYSDKRDQEDQGMEDWDQDTLERAIAQKHGNEKNNKNKTDIVCKFFIDAVELKKYGWFWKCPNGDTCMYRHALPPGYVLKSQMKALLEQEAAEKMRDVSESIEEERSKVKAQTQVTEEVFRKWRDDKMAAKERAKQAEVAERQKKGKLTGREIFLLDNFVAVDDESASKDTMMNYLQQDEAEIKSLEAQTLARVAEAAREADTVGSGEARASTVPTPARDFSAAASHDPTSSQTANSQAPSSAANGATQATGGTDEAGPSGGAGDDVSDEESEEVSDISDDELDAMEAKLGGVKVG